MLIKTIRPSYAKLNLPKDFSLSTQIDFLQREKNVLLSIKNDSIRRVITINNINTLIKISFIKEELIIDFLKSSRPITDEIREQILHYVIDWFDLTRDLTPFYTMAKKDHLLKKAASQFYGLRHLGTPDLLEALCNAIIGQQISMTVASSIKRNFITRYGETLVYKNEDYLAFPSANVIASLTVEELRQVKLSVRKCEYIINIAQLIVSKKLSKDELIKLNDFTKVEQKLLDIRGIGPWTAHSILMHSFREPTAFPTSDIGLINAVKKIENRSEKPTVKEMMSLSDKWGNWKSYAAFYLWQSLYAT